MPKFDKHRFVSNLDALKEIIGARPEGIELERIVEEMQKKYFPDKSPQEITTSLVQPVLGNRRLFEVADGKYHLAYSNLPEHRAARDILDEQKRLIPFKELRELIGKRLKQPLKRVFFFPERDPTFKQIELSADGVINAYWVPLQWRVINDDAFELLRREKSVLSEKEVEEKVRLLEGETGDVFVFDPEHDPRFERQKKRWGVKGDAAAPPPGKESTWVVAETLKEKVAASLESALLNMAGEARPISLHYLSHQIVGKNVEEIRDTLYFTILYELLRQKEHKGELVLVRGDVSTVNPHLAWRLPQDIPHGVYSVPPRTIPFEPAPYELLTDRGLDPDFVEQLSDPQYYFCDGDFSETQFPPSGSSLVITYNELMTGIVLLGAPVKATLRKEMGLSFDVPAAGAHSVVELEVRTPGGNTHDCFVNLKTGLLFGLEDWISGSTEPGTVLRLRVAAPYVLTLEQAGLLEVPVLADEEFERLSALVEQAGRIALRMLVIQLLSAAKDGMMPLDLFHRVNFVHKAGRRHVYSLLCSSYAFQKKDSRWKFLPERLEWGERRLPLAYSRDFAAHRAFAYSFAGTRPPLREKDGRRYLVSKSDKAIARARDFLFLFSRGEGAFTADCVVQSVDRKKEGEEWLEVPRFERWGFPVAPDKSSLELYSRAVDLISLRSGDVEAILQQYDRLFYVQTLKKSVIREFKAAVLPPSLSQKAKDEIKELEGYLEEDKGTFSVLKGMSWQLQMTPTFEEFQKILEEKFYSRGELVRLKPWELQQAMEKIRPSLPRRILCLPLGDGESAVALLEEIKKLLNEGGYSPEEDGVRFFVEGSEIAVPWERVLSDRRRADKIRSREDHLSLDEALAGALPEFFTCVEPRRDLFLIASLNLRFKAFHNLRLVFKPLDEFFREAVKPDELNAKGYDLVVGDLRNLPARDLHTLLNILPSALKENGKSWFFSGPLPKASPLSVEIDFSDSLKLVSFEK